MEINVKDGNLKLESQGIKTLLRCGGGGKAHEMDGTDMHVNGGACQHKKCCKADHLLTKAQTKETRFKKSFWLFLLD